MKPQTFPSFADYQSALQHPEMAFSSNFLRQGMVESDLWGFPRVRSGGFALTYKIALKDENWAARCFHRAVRDRAIRYAQICHALEESQLPFFVPTRYIPHGIAVHGKQFPISILKWVDGESLESYVFHHLDEPQVLLELSEEFRNVCKLMENNGLAHGDLSHRNILIKSGKIFLIDYDGMFVPALKGRKSCELGNIHFQHPLRTSLLFNNHIDRFSSIVIYLALLALAADSSVWQSFQSGGEGLVFQRSDYLNPEQSKLLHILEHMPSTSRYIPRFRQICQSSVDSVPSLEDLVGESSYKPIINTYVLENNKKKRLQIPILDALSVENILHVEGEIVTVIGQISEVFHGYTDHGEDHIFINFGNWQENCFTAILWGTVLDDLRKLDLSLDFWEGRWMSVTGLVSVRKFRPQIQIEAVTDLVLIPSEEKAIEILEQAQKSGFSKNRKLNPLLFTSTSANPITRPITLHESSNSTGFDLEAIFEKPVNPSIETILNQLYAPDRFKTNSR